jgi:hypothetical protein
MEAAGLLALALGDEAKLGVREGREGQLQLAQEPRAQKALELDPERALPTRHRTASLDPQLPVGAAVAPRPVLDPRLRPHALKVEAGVDIVRGRDSAEHRVSINSNDTGVICNHDEIGRTINISRLLDNISFS